MMTVCTFFHPYPTCR